MINPHIPSAKRRIGAVVLATALVAGLGAYHFLQPTGARAALSSSTGPIDESKVSTLLSLDQDMETVAARVTPAIVNVAVTAKVNQKAMMQQQGMPEGMPDDMQQFFERQFGGHGQMQPQQPQFQHGIGSGVIISPDGYIITNNHVVDGATDIKVTLGDRRILSAKLIGTDPLTDLAVIKIEGSNFPNIPLGDSTQLRPGQTVLAFGNPFGFRFTVTRGIVSALNRPNPYNDDPRKPGQYIQTDAAINQGNSGGPLVNARGEVIGINTFLISPSGSFSGMGFAIPTQIVQPTVDSLVRYGKVSHSYIGVGITDVTPENSKFFDLKDANGAVISEVQPDSPGARAGLKVGDVIVGLDGKKVAGAGELQAQVSEMRPGTKVTLDVLRDGKSMNVPVTLEELGSKDKTEELNASADNGKPRWGVGIADLTSDVREQLQAPSTLKGAVIQRVQPGSPAEEAGLQPGDVIQSVDRKPTPTAADVQKALSSVPKGQDAMVLVWGNGGSTFRVLHATSGA
ncbi:MAG: Do family serine endopeptidase, partial [Candidatus Korobacteraceae bacterium]